LLQMFVDVSGLFLISSFFSLFVCYIKHN
jgi:hypothetical protein